MRRTILVFLLSLYTASAADSQTIRIYDDPGGFLPDYAYRFSLAAKSGDQIVIAGRCGSACTLVLRYVPRDQVCFIPGGSLQFHEAGTAEGTAWLKRNYPPAVMRWINARGGLTGRVLTLQGTELSQFVRGCDTA